MRFSPEPAPHRAIAPTRRALVLALTLGSLASVACGDGDATEPGGAFVESVTVTPSLDTLRSVGATVQLAALALDKTGEPVPGRTFTWSSSRTGTATVEPSSGLVTAVGAGDATITATTGEVSGTAVISVVLPEPPLPPPGPPPLPAVVVGDMQSCAIREDGSVWCWGENDSGVFGTGDQVDSPNVPIPAAGGLSLAAMEIGPRGSGFACAIAAEGTTYCWGDNGDGNLGLGTVTDFEATPQAVAGAFRNVTTGEKHACALDEEGLAHCWGRNSFGRLGDGTTTDRPTPAPVSGDFGFDRIDAGTAFTCALDREGAAYCWGNGSDGALGSGSETDRLVPTPVSFGEAFVDISAGDDHACALSADGRGFCWGSNSEGQVGDGTSENDRLTPVEVAGGLTFRIIEAGFRITCGITMDDSAYCWGEGEDGALGNGSLEERYTPTQVAGGLAWHAVAPGEEHSCGVTTDGTFYCWGNRSNGTIGDGYPESYATPQEVSGGLTFAGIDAGSYACGVTAAGDGYCWGEGPSGDGTFEVRAAPTAVTGGVPFASIGVGAGLPTEGSTLPVFGHACGVTSGEQAHCWGVNASGQLGDGTTVDRAAPEPVGSSENFVQVVGDRGHSCGLGTGGEAWCWGSNQAGQLGDGTTTSSTTPVRVVGSLSFESLSAGPSVTCGIAQGTVHCWGSLYGSSTPTSGPEPLFGSLTFVSVSVGEGGHACGLSDRGEAWCWGSNAFGQLGDGTTAGSPDAPVQVSGGLSLLSVSAGGAHSCGLAEGGQAYCWGLNDVGQLGIGSSDVQRLQPALVAGGLSFVDVRAGAGHTCALTTSGQAYCWGRGAAVGDGLDREDPLEPRAVALP